MSSLSNFNGSRFRSFSSNLSESRLQKITRFLPCDLSGKGLDLGCGDGRFSSTLIRPNLQIFGIDLTVGVDSRLDPSSPLFLMVVDARSLRLRASEGLWLRIVDVEGALGGRSYATDDAIVVELSDDFCPWNAGRWRLGREVVRTDEPAELELDVSDLACVYLGAFDFSRLAAAERVRELKDGALVRADVLFRTPRPPYCPEDF